MQIDITGHQMDVTEALRGHVNKRLERLNQHQEPSLNHVHVVLEVAKNHHTCNMRTHSGRDEFVAHGEDSDLYSAIDRAADKMERQLREAKERRLSRRG